MGSPCFGELPYLGVRVYGVGLGESQIGQLALGLSGSVIERISVRDFGMLWCRVSGLGVLARFCMYGFKGGSRLFQSSVKTGTRGHG